jgi:hypothetical protein
MSHDQGDGIVSAATGSIVALMAHAASWVQAATWMGEVAHTLVFGLIGGAAGFLGKRMLEKLFAQNERTKNDR